MKYKQLVHDRLHVSAAPRIVAICTALAFTAPVHTSAAIITEWSYTTNATFDAASFESGGSGTTVVSDAEVSWGDDGGNFTTDDGAADNRSALTFGSVPAFLAANSATEEITALTQGGPVGANQGTVKTNFDGTPDPTTEVGKGISLTHWNQPISGIFNTLLSATIIDTLTLTPVSPTTGSDVDAPEITFNFNFRETNNAGPCAGGTATPCGDLLGFSGIPSTNLPFTYDGEDYLANVVLSNDDFTSVAPIGTLNNGQCDELDFPNGCQGFLTDESARTTVSFGFFVSTEQFNPVPAPMPLALMALGGLLLATRQVSRDRRR